MRALYDVECPVWQRAHLRESTEMETDRPFKCSFSLGDRNPMSVLLDHDERIDWTQGASPWLLRPCTTRGDHE